MPGQFIWYDLLSDDPAATAAFYRAVIGWEVRVDRASGLEQRLLSLDGVDVAGIVARPPGMEVDAPARWMGYVAVADADAAVADVAAAGGRVLVPPMDIPGGRFALVADPEGVRLDLLRPDGSRATPPFRADAAGQVVWHELHARDAAAAFSYHAARFGWTAGEGFDMGPMGRYQLFGVAGGEPVGGMMVAPADAAPHWLFYFGVDEIGAACARVEAAGGRVVQPPAKVPGGARIAVARDPGDVPFGLCAPPRADRAPAR